MNKNIVIIILVAASLLNLLYAFTQRLEAQRQEQLSSENREMAQLQMKSCMEEAERTRILYLECQREQSQ